MFSEAVLNVTKVSFFMNLSKFSSAKKQFIMKVVIAEQSVYWSCNLKNTPNSF